MPELSLSSESLPRAHVLSYITTVRTPTRVRVIAARVTMIAGPLNVVTALCLIGMAGKDVYELAVDRTMPGIMLAGPVLPPPPARPLEIKDFLAASRDFAREHSGWIAAMALAMGSAIVLLLAAPSIKCGRRAGSLLALLYFAVAMVVVGCIGLLLICAGFTQQFMQHPRWYDWWAVWWLLLIPVAAMPVVLLKDVCAFLLWIVRHPIAEKPPVPFLPGGDRVAKASEGHE